MALTAAPCMPACSVVPTAQAAAAAPVITPLCEDWGRLHFTFCCSEAAVKLGLGATYAQVTAGK